MATDIKINADHDIDLTTPMVLVSGGEHLMQRLHIKFKTLYGEWYLDTTIGLKLFEIAFRKNPEIKLIDNLFLLTLKEEPEVKSILSYESFFNSTTRVYNFNFKIESIYGILESTGSL